MGADHAAEFAADPVIWFVDDYKLTLKRAVDFLKGKNLDVLIAQVRRLLDGPKSAAAGLDRHEAFREGAFVRSLGFSEWYLDLLTEICRGLPKLVDVAERLGRSPQQVNKAISRIYKKLDLEHYGQLTHLLAILEMFSRRVTDDWE